MLSALTFADEAVTFKDDMTEANFRSKRLRIPGAMIVAAFLRNAKKLKKLDVSNNRIRSEGGLSLAKGLIGHSSLTELNLSNNDMGRFGSFDTPDVKAILAIADTIKTMRAALLTINILSLIHI